MSEIMYNDFSNWKEIVKTYAISNDKQIKGFFGDYRWLSNFYRSPVSYEGLIYVSVENGYQAAKIIQSERNNLTNCSPVEAKKNWKNYTKIKETAAQWDNRKYQVMAGLIFEKFLNNLDIRLKLLDTGNRYLEETNHWSDVYWGVDIKKGGQNNLGQILMQTRDYWRKQNGNNLS